MDKRQAKKNEKRQQENAVKSANKTVEAKATKTVVAKAKKAEPEKQLEKTTIYGMSAIIYTLVSAVTVVLSMIMWIKPGYYYIESLLGKTLDFYSLDISYEMGYKVVLPKSLGMIFIAIGIICVVSTLLSVLMVSKTMKAVNKPYPIVSVISFLLTVVAVVLFFVGVSIMKDKYYESQMDQIYEAQKSFNIYYGMMIAIIANVVVAFFHMIMTFVSTNIWKKTGKVR